MPGQIFDFQHLAGETPFILGVDLVLTGLLFYQIFMALRGSKAIPLLNGLAIIFLLSLVSDWLRFYIFAGLLKYILSILVIAIPVLFQPELRRALEQLGKRNILTRYLRFTQETPFQTIQAVSKAAMELSRTRTGALIVLERDASLEEIMESGNRLDAVVSSVLIRQIFEKNTPLHDGAIVIRGGRIAAAGCLLPLSVRTNLPSEWGTRHRAGIGITENSDAIVIIISEERGTVTLAVDGDITAIRNEERLLQRLKDLTATEKKGSKRRLKHHE